jgi:GAF domain-containing protein
MKMIKAWYLNLSLRRRFVYTFNIVLFLTLSFIAIPALLNRVNNQFRDANNLLLPNLEELSMMLSIAGQENQDDYKQIFYRKKPYNTGYASLIAANGMLVIDPMREGINVGNEEYFPKMRQMKRGRIPYTDRTAKQGHQRKHIFFIFSDSLNSYLTFTIDHKELISNPLKNTMLILIFAFIFSSLIFTITITSIAQTISKPLVNLQSDFDKIGKGILPHINIRHKYNDELGHMIGTIKAMLEGLRQKTLFAHEIGKNNFSHNFKPLSNEDVLGNALIDMRDSLKKASLEEDLRKKEDDKRNWITHGLAQFSDILRQNDNNIKELSYKIIKNLVKYMEANQGGIFILNEENQKHKYLELTGCYAYDRRKYLEKSIEIGEGLVGSCFMEQKSTYISQLPQDYLKITSGLGGENPGYLLLVPLKLNENTIGVIEMASFKAIEPHQIDFMQKLAESIASAIISTKTAEQTKQLLAQSQVQAEEMRAQEEEMRQNMEELTATQEESSRKNSEMENIIREYQHKILAYRQQVETLERRLIQSGGNISLQDGLAENLTDEALRDEMN